MVQNAMFNFNPKTGALDWEINGDKLLHGETDGSAYLHGGRRQCTRLAEIIIFGQNYDKYYKFIGSIW